MYKQSTCFLVLSETLVVYLVYVCTDFPTELSKELTQHYKLGKGYKQIPKDLIMQSSTMQTDKEEKPSGSVDQADL